MSNQTVTLPANSNQALGIAQYAIDFLTHGSPDQSVRTRTELFHTDASLCGISALALNTTAPSVLRNEALNYPAQSESTLIPSATLPGATVFGSSTLVAPEKAIVANCSAVREWDSNGTNFGFRPELNHTAGEFGHNDFYSVPIAAAQLMKKDGNFALQGMILLDEIRGRLAEVFSLKTYKVDHVLHGAIASAATFGAMIGATDEQIESAIGMTVAHYVPFRAIRAGKQLSDSKGASAAITTEAAILSVIRSINGFRGPRDIFRNPEAIFRLFEGPGQMFYKASGTGVPPVNSPSSSSSADASPFELVLSMSGDDFAVMGMHFKLGLYEHQSAGAIQAVLNLLADNPSLISKQDGSAIKAINIQAYEPAFGIIGDPAKKNPQTRQSADHSMAYIIATLIRKACELGSLPTGNEAWTSIMLMPHDYQASDDAVFHPTTRSIMDKITFTHGGPDYDAKYPDGIPTSLTITDDSGATHDSGLIMYPAGHARNTTHDLAAILNHKFTLLAALAHNADPALITTRYSNLSEKSADELAAIHDFPLTQAPTRFD